MLKFEIGTFYIHVQKKNLAITWLCMVINVVSSYLETKFIEGIELNLDLDPVSIPIIPLVYLNVCESGNQVFSVLLFF